MNRNSLLIISLLSLGFSACNTSDPEPSQPYDNGVLILNAGNFLDNNGSISLVQRTSTTASFDIFQKENSRTLAGGLADYTEVNSKGIILVDNSTAGKDIIEIVDARTFKSLSTIPSSDIENPRVAVKATDTKAYVTCWDATGDYSNFYKSPGYVAVIDLTTNKLAKKITVQNGAESITVIGTEAFVGNTGTGTTKITVIDIATDAVKQTIEIGKNPALLGVDANSKLWLYAGGEMVRLNTQTKTVETRFKITSPNASKSPSSFTLSADKKTFYFTNSYYDAAADYVQRGETYSFSVDAAAVAADKPFINRLFSGGLGVDPQTGTIYAGVVPSFKQAGYVLRYQPNGTLIDSVKAEIAPSKFFFKK
ncbi:YncE family protein [Runella sp.]|uniref:YncE family protein n=1 Tax=Runella sp. TaxID=1960881 RepID=UPI003D13AD05